MKDLDNRKFYNASEAFQMANAINNEIKTKQLVDLFDKIDSYVRAGETECVFVELTDFQMNWLKDNGYIVSKIENTNTYKDGFYNVSWKKSC